MHDDGNGPPWGGRGNKLHEALDAAWCKARDKGHQEAGWFEVKSIKILTENPIRAYSVTIEPTDPPPDG